MAPLMNKGTTYLPESAGPYVSIPYAQYVQAVDNNDLPTLRQLISATWPTDLEGIIEPLDMDPSEDVTLLQRAVKLGHLAIVRYLVEEVGADIEVQYASFLIHFAAEFGQLEVAKYIVEQSPDLHLEHDSNGDLAIHLAAENGKIDLVRFFVEEKGVDVNVEGCDDRKPFYYAAVQGHLEVVKYLVEHGADVMALDYQVGRTGFHFAVEYNRIEVVRYLARLEPKLFDVMDYYGLYPIHVAAEKNAMDCLKFFVEECGINPDFNSPDVGNWTPLACAIRPCRLNASLENMDAIRYLIKQGANLSVRVSDLEVPLTHIALETKRFDLLIELLELNPDLVKAKDKAGRTLTDVINEMKQKGTFDSPLVKET